MKPLTRSINKKLPNKGAFLGVKLVHLRDALSNLTEPLKRLFRALSDGKIAELLTGEPRVTKPASHSRQRRLTVEQKSELVGQYKAGGESIYSLAKTWGISPHTVSTHLREAGLSLGFKPLSYAEIAKARKLRREGLSFNAIGRSLRRDPKTVKAALG